MLVISAHALHQAIRMGSSGEGDHGGKRLSQKVTVLRPRLHRNPDDEQATVKMSPLLRKQLGVLSPLESDSAAAATPPLEAGSMTRQQVLDCVPDSQRVETAIRGRTPRHLRASDMPFRAQPTSRTKPERQSPGRRDGAPRFPIVDRQLAIIEPVESLDPAVMSVAVAPGAPTDAARAGARPLDAIPADSGSASSATRSRGARAIGPIFFVVFLVVALALVSWGLVAWQLWALWSPVR